MQPQVSVFTDYVPSIDAWFAVGHHCVTVSVHVGFIRVFEGQTRFGVGYYFTDTSEATPITWRAVEAIDQDALLQQPGELGPKLSKVMELFRSQQNLSRWGTPEAASFDWSNLDAYTATKKSVTKQ